MLSLHIGVCRIKFYLILQQLLERTRQRRAMLNQKLGKTPDPAPRKRVLEDTTNMPVKSPTVDDGKNVHVFF